DRKRLVLKHLLQFGRFHAAEQIRQRQLNCHRPGSRRVWAFRQDHASEKGLTEFRKPRLVMLAPNKTAVFLRLFDFRAHPLSSDFILHADTAITTPFSDDRRGRFKPPGNRSPSTAPHSAEVPPRNTARLVAEIVSPNTR